MIKLDKKILASLLLLGTVQAANIDIQWSIQDYEDITAQVGDTITFTWASGHNVYIHPTGTCDPEGAILVGETSPATYTFTADNVDEDLFFVCAISGHCDAGQTITVSVTDAGGATGEVSPPSSVPLVSGSGAPSVLLPDGETGSAVPTALVVEGEVATPAPTPFQTSNETATGTESPTTAPMEDGSASIIPSLGPSTLGGSGTQAPTGSSSAPMIVPTMAGLASAALAMALALLME